MPHIVEFHVSLRPPSPAVDLTTLGSETQTLTGLANLSVAIGSSDLHLF